MATVWHNLTVRLENDRRYMLADFHQWLADGFNAGRGWDRTVSEMLTATGRYAENPAAGYYLSVDSNKDVAIKSARLFLGTRLECAECHNHPYAPWGHDNHWGWVAFFSRTRNANNGGELDRKVAFASAEESVPTPGSKLREYQLLPPRGAIKIPTDSATNVGKVVPPRFLDNTVPELGNEPPYRPTHPPKFAAAFNRSRRRSPAFPNANICHDWRR